MTDLNKPVAQPDETLVHLHFINPSPGPGQVVVPASQSTWIGTSISRGLHVADGRMVLTATIDVGEAADGGDPDATYVVHELTVHPTAAAAILAETAKAAPLGSRVRIHRPDGPYDLMTGVVAVHHPCGELGKVGVAIDGREGVAVFLADDVTVLPREAVDAR